MRRIAMTAGLALVGCDEATPAPDGAVPPDAGPPSACQDLLSEAPPWSVYRCADGASFSFRFEGLPLFESMRMGLEVGGQITWGATWPEVSWMGTGGEVQVRFFGHPDLPELGLTLGVRAGVRLVPTLFAQADTALDALHIEGRVDGLVPGLPATAAHFFQGFEGPSGAVLVHALGFDFVGSGRPPEVARVGEIPGGVRLTWPLARAFVAGPGQPLDGVRLVAGADSLALDDEVADGVAAPRVAVLELGHGWRTGPAYGPALSAEALQREVEVLRTLARERGLESAPAVLVEGAWFAAPGDWQGGLVPGLAGLDAQVGLVWPAAFGAGQPAEILDVSLPASQDAIGRAALALQDAGVDWLVVTGVPEGDGPALAGLGRALAPFTGPLLTDQPALVPYLQGLGLLGSLPDPQACWLAALAGSGRCAPLAAPLPRPRGPLADSPDALESWAHLAGHIMLDAGGVRLGGTAGEGRISAVLNAGTGGPYLLADAPSQLTPAQADLFFEVFALKLGGLRPRAVVDGRATRWESADALVLINWGEAAQTLTLPDRPGLDGAPRRLGEGPGYASGAQVVVSPRDLVLYRR